MEENDERSNTQSEDNKVANEIKESELKSFLILGGLGFIGRNLLKTIYKL
jgi:hypothetical protein